MGKIINGSSLALALANYLCTNAYLNDTAQDVLIMVGNWIDEAQEITVPKWIPVSERLPEENTYVLILCGCYVHVAKIEIGIDEQIRDAMKRGELPDPLIPTWSASTGYTCVKRSMLYSGCDVHGNNHVPYCWYSNYGPGKWFGQQVSHWMPLPAEPQKEDV